MPAGQSAAGLHPQTGGVRFNTCASNAGGNRLRTIRIACEELDRTLDPFLDLRLGQRADLGGRDLALAEDHHGRNAAHAVFLRHVGFSSILILAMVTCRRVPPPVRRARRDTEGYYWFVGRADDVIKSAGHLIGPFEVESALMEHKAVAEAGVIGIPDEIAGETVKAFVALKDGVEPTEQLRKELLGHARKCLGPAIAPKDIAFRKTLPKTRSGKIMRRLLKANELGLPQGDLSTLESEEQ